MIIDIVQILVVGLLIGALARFLLPGRDPMGCLMTAVVGVAGSFVGGFLGDLLLGGSSDTGVLHPAGLLGSVVGTVLILLALRFFRSGD